MSVPSFSEMPTAQKDQLACTLAALILNDNGSDVNAESLTRVLKAAKVEVPSYWPMLFSRALEGKNVADYLVVSGGSGSGAPTGDNAAVAEVEKEETEEEVEEEEESYSMGGLFG